MSKTFFHFFSARLGIASLAVLFAIPTFVIVGHVVLPSDDVWSHIVDTVLAEYLLNSFWLILGVIIGTTLLGVSTAWLTSMCQFKGRSFFEWALLLPMAMPAYIIAYTYTGLLDFAGPVQSQIRALTGWGYRDYWFPEIRSVGGAVAMLTLVLYPYVYLLVRASFLSQSICVLDVSRTLGNSYTTTFFRVALPLARPAVIAGLSLVLMETLADYGTVAYFGVSTFTTGIFRTWFGMGSPTGAAQLAAVLMGFVLLLVVVEKWSRKQAQYHHTSRRHQNLQRIPLSCAQSWSATFFCGVVLAISFVIPATQLLLWSIEVQSWQNSAAFELLLNSLMLAGVTAIIAVTIALVLSYSRRLLGGKTVRSSVQLVSMGYAIPGAVIAVGVMIPFAWFDNTLDAFMRETFDISTGLLLSGTLFAVIFAYLVRFLAVAIQTVDSGLNQISPSMDKAGRSLGYRPREILSRVHLPMLKASLLTAVLLVFVDVLKELPATLILRPFNFNTLAVKTYELASDERLMDAAPYALAIVIAGLLPVLVLSLTITRTRKLDTTRLMHGD